MSLLTNGDTFPLYARKIKCPLHHTVIPGREPFVVEVNPFFRDSTLSDADCKKFGIRKWKYKKDAHGRKIPNYNNHYQPEISAAFAIEHIYDPERLMCKNCGRCTEGQPTARVYKLKQFSNH